MALFINGVGQDSFSMNGVSIDNLYVDNVLVWSSVVVTEDPPIYLMTEPLENDGSFDYLFNSADSGEQFNGKLLTQGDTAWNPTAQEYPQDGTIDLSGGNKADTQWTPPADSEWTFSFIYDVIMDTSYKMFSLNSKGDGTANVLYDGVLDPVDTGLLYTPPVTNMILTENMVSTDVPAIPICIVTMSTYELGVGDTALVTLDFNVDTNWVSGSAGEFTAENGTLGEFTQVSKRKYTLVFTPTEDVSDDTNIITVAASVGSFGNPYQDNWGNECTNDFYSPNYTVNTVDSPSLGEEVLRDTTMDGAINDGVWTRGIAGTSTVNMAGGECTMVVNPGDNCQLRQLDVSITSGVTYRLGINISDVVLDGAGIYFYSSRMSSGGDVFYPTTPGWYYEDVVFNETITYDVLYVIVDKLAGAAEYVLTDITMKEVL